MQEWISTVLFGHPPPRHTVNTAWATRAIGHNENRKDTHQGKSFLKAFDGSWVKTMFEDQGGFSPRHLGHMELHRCTEAHCLFRISVDRIDNEEKEHRRDNCALTTFAENLSKMSMRKDIPMTNRRWQMCVIARIENLLSVLSRTKQAVPGISDFIRRQLNWPATRERLQERLRDMRENLTPDSRSDAATTPYDKDDERSDCGTLLF
jgi:hypothetical protein